jgi:sugar (pentulose or hexulose) kinase
VISDSAGRTELLVGIDMGTTRVKAVAVDQHGRVHGESERPTPWRHDGGRADVDPAALATLAFTVAAEAATGARPTASGPGSAGRGDPWVRGIGVTGMAETGVLVDAHDRPLAPAIAWHDPRGDVETIEREIGAETFQATTGLPLTALPSLSKLLWLRRNHSEAKAAVRFYSVGEWVVRRFGGDAVAEFSLASRTGLLDLTSGRPWEAAFGLLDSRSLLSEPVVAGTPVGIAHGDDVPAALHGAVLTVAGHDHQTAAYGVGAATDGALFNSLGTAEALVRSVRPTLSSQQVGTLAGQGMSVGWGVVAGHMCILAGIPTGLTLSRLAAMLGMTTVEDRRRLGEQAVALGPQALAAPAGQPPLHLVAPRYEHFGIAGITDGVTPALLWRAAVDSLVVEADRALHRIDAVAGAYRRVVIAGGWLHNPAVLAAKRAQYPALRTTDIGEPGAYGAARMAASAAGLSLPDALALAPAGTSANATGPARQAAGTVKHAGIVKHATGPTAQITSSTEESKGR